jgi:hypothetical protein
MKLAIVLPWLCAAGLLAGAGTLYFSNQKLQADLAQLRQESQSLQTQRAADDASNAQTQAAADELTRLRKDNEDLLRLRNEVRQLRQEKQQLTTQLQTVQAQAQDALARAQAARTAAAPALTPEQLQALQARPALDLAANNCINNLRQIDVAKNQWALEHQKPAYTLVAAPDITPYLPAKALPACPAGGAYTLNGIGVLPTCSIPGHAIPK